MSPSGAALWGIWVGDERRHSGLYVSKPALFLPGLLFDLNTGAGAGGAGALLALTLALGFGHCCWTAIQPS